MAHGQAQTFEELEASIDQNLVRIGGELTVPELLQAYRSGCFPWTVQPVTWWSPDPRAILELDGFHISRSLERVLRQGRFEVTYDAAFRQVIEACARPTANRRTTWITPEFVDAYTALHTAGHAHSVEIWQSGQLIGGVYGLGQGAYFAGESMFHRVSNASKIALFHLVQRLRERGYDFLDVEMPTRGTVPLGVTTIPRAQFLRRLQAALQKPVTFGPASERT